MSPLKKTLVLSIYATLLNPRQAPTNGNGCFLGQHIRHLTRDGQDQEYKHSLTMV